MYIGEENYNKECLALEFYNEHLKSKSFKALSSYYSIKKQEQEKEERDNEKADLFFKGNHLKDCFAVLVDYVKSRKEKNQRSNTAFEHYREINLSNFFIYWKLQKQNNVHFKELEVSSTLSSITKTE